jgi:hypothetical protein
MGMVDFTFFPTSVRMATFGEIRGSINYPSDSTPLYNPYCSNTPLLLPMGKRGAWRKQKIIQLKQTI